MMRIDRRLKASAALASSVLVLLLAEPAVAAPGARDFSFDDDGRATVDFGTAFEGGEAVAVGANGGILMVGGIDQGGPDESLAMARLTSAGEPDLTFSGDGQHIVPSVPYANGVALQEDEKIVVVGPGSSGSSTGWRIARFGSDGTPDQTFGGGDGIVITDLNPNEVDAPLDVAVQSDGKILVVGTKGLSDGYRMAVARYGTDGELDPDFGNGGIRTVSFGQAARARALALQTNGKIVVVGEVQRVGQIDWGVVRLLADGTLDSSFSGDGRLAVSFGGTDQASDVAIQSDGKIIVVGKAGPTATRGPDFGVARLNRRGRLDPTFSGDGLNRTDFKGEEDWARGVAIQANGKIVVGGYALTGGIADFAVARYTAGGRLNLAFGNQGRVRTDLGAHNDDFAFDVALDGVGLVLVGWGRPTSGYDAAAVRYLLS